MARASSYDAWRKAVLSRDGHRCIFCQSTERLQADHIKPHSRHPELRLEIDNGRTLCAPCHKRTPTYGGNMTRGQRREKNPYGGASHA
jgi:5-methylcytosine-specific restriction endonuclease McrA